VSTKNRSSKYASLTEFVSSLTFKRTVSREKSFDDEPRKPPLGNLATHMRDKHPNVGSEPPVDNGIGATGMSRGVSAASAKIMEDFLKDGVLNPALVPTQKGFHRVFAAWILEDDLAFTTGETNGIHRLFRYMQSRFTLPSDTTVRNTLHTIFSDLYDLMRKEISVCCFPNNYELPLTISIQSVKSKIACSTDTWTTRSMMYSFAGTIASWVTEDWELVERVIGFEPIGDKEHEGEYAAKAFTKTLSDMKVLDKMS
jgi:hypothetical protein